MRALLAAALGGLAFVSPVQAQEIVPLPGVCLTLEDVMEQARASDPDVIIAQAREREADADIIEARSLWRPRVDTIFRTGAGSTSVVNTGVSNSAGLRASQRLFDFGDAKFARQAARADFAASQSETRQAQLDAVRLAGIAVLDFQQAEAQIAVTRKRRDYFQRQLDAVDALLDRGGATRTERAAVALQLADAERSGLELQFLRDEARARIEAFTASAAPICQSDRTQAAPAVTAFASADDAVRAALANNPTLRAQEQRADALAARKKREARARLPVIELVGTGTYSSLDRFDNFEFRERIGVDISVPLYSGNVLGARRQRASAQEGIARGTALDIRRNLRRDVTVVWQRIASLRQQSLRREDVRDQARLQFEAAQIEQSAGTQTLRELVEVRLDFEQAALAAIGARYDLQRQILQLRALTDSRP